MVADYPDVTAVLSGQHNSFETAVVIPNYPYGRLRTEMRMWVEGSPKKGWRCVSCTLNPKTGKWNKPHAGTYATVTVLYINDKGHIHPAKFYGDSWRDALEFYEVFNSGLSAEQEKVMYWWIACEKAYGLYDHPRGVARLDNYRLPTATMNGRYGIGNWFEEIYFKG